MICDATTQDNINFLQSYPAIFPGFNKILKNSKIYNNFFACAPVTEMVLPSIFSGSYPLDQGGYENGMKDKKDSLIKILENNNYDLKILSASSWLSNIYNYSDNNKTIEHLFSVQNAWQSFQKAYLQYIKLNLQENNIELSYVKEVILKHFNFFKFFIKDDFSFFTKFILGIKKKNHQSVIKNIDLHINQFSNNPQKYLSENIDNMLKSNFGEFFFKKNISFSLYKIFNKFFWNRKKSEIPNIFLEKLNFEIRSPSQKMLANKFFEKLELFWSKDEKRSKAIFLHFFDVHDRNFSSNQIFKYIADEKKNLTKEIRQEFADDRKLMSLLYVDKLIFNFLNKNKDKLKNSTLVLTSDHGVTFQNGESCLNSTSLPGSFHDAYINIPFIVMDNEVKKEINNNLHSSIDILSIVTKALKIDKKAEDNFNFSNRKLNIDNDNYVLLEHCHRGPSSQNLKKGIVYQCLRSTKYKYIYKSKTHPKDPQKNTQEIFIDLISDPKEKKNSINEIKYIEIVNKIREITKNRLNQII